MLIDLRFISSISDYDNSDLNLTNEKVDIVEFDNDDKLTTVESNCCEEIEPQTCYVAPFPDKSKKYNFFGCESQSSYSENFNKSVNATNVNVNNVSMVEINQKYNIFNYCCI